MKNSILIVTNDNVFYLLIDSYIKATGHGISCKKVMHHNEIELSDKNTADLILVDGKMTLTSPIHLIYELRYNYKLKAPIWFATEIKTQSYLDKAIEVGASRIINKPFDIIELTTDIVRFFL